MRVLLADPPAYTPPYDHALASALARAGAEVELVTSRFRFGEVPEPDGYVRSELFYPLSSRLFRRSRLRLPRQGRRAPVRARPTRRCATATSSTCSGSPRPELDARLLRLRRPSVFTAHDILPRRTAGKPELWRRLWSRFDRVVVHSERGREALARFGFDARVIPHPVFPSDPPRADDGHTVLFFGVIRPYRGLPDAIAAVRQVDGARLLVAGDPAMPLDPFRGEPGIEWRLGYLPEAEVDRAHGEATVAVFPYRPELDQSGALLRALGAGVPAVVYDVGGLGEPVRALRRGARRGAGRRRRRSPRRSATVLADPEPFREGARRARAELTWDAAAAAHLALYEELL